MISTDSQWLITTFLYSVLLFNIIVLIINIFVIRNIVRKAYSVFEKINELVANNYEQMKRITSMFESVSQRVVILNKRLKLYIDQFGVKDIENIKRSVTSSASSKKRAHGKSNPYANIY